MTPLFLSLRHLAIGVAMLAAAGLAYALVPRHMAADHRPSVDLETLIPERFGAWRMEAQLDHLQVSPDVQAEIDKIYNQTLARTYRDDQGRFVMLSIAYGGDQSDSLAVHLPEGCYRGQGFDVTRARPWQLRFGDVEVPVMRLVAEKGPRVEPISYWVLIGDSYAYNRTNRKLAQLRYSLTGRVPEGMLVRVSSIGRDHDQAYALHQRFLEDMIAAVPEQQRARLIGGGVH